MQIRGEGLMGEAGEGSADAAAKVVYNLHPNVALDELGVEDGDEVGPTPDHDKIDED